MNAHLLFEDFKRRTILVVGDVMIDAYLKGKVNRVSPEAPVPIVNIQNNEERLGGAANVALNLIGLGAKAIICSLIGKDDDGDRMVELFKDSNIDTSGLVQSENRTTTVKTRVLGNNQQLLRIDKEETNDINAEQEKELIAKIEDLIVSGNIDAIILEDYNKGVLTKDVIQAVVKLANDNGVITTVDPKHKNFFEYKNVTLFKPNLKEMAEGLKKSISFEDETTFVSAVEELIGRLNAKQVLITLSEHGVFIANTNENHHIPAHIRKIADVSGAGDTVICVATLCLVAGLSLDKVALISNLAGGLVCEEIGVVAIDKELLFKELCKTLDIC